MPYLFFESSKSAYKEITNLFNFIWPTTAAMWNLRWQVNGYFSVKPEATDSEIYGRFVNGSGIQTNLKKTYQEQDWDHQQEQFARIILTNIFAIHESWCAEIRSELNMGKALEKELQFPTGLNPSTGSPNGITPAIKRVCNPKSLMLETAFYSELKKSKKYRLANIDNLMKCYRYFKECRNAIMHNGGKVNNKLIDSYNEFSIVSNVMNLGVDEVPVHYPVSTGDVGKKVKVDLRGVVGFCDAIIKIIYTCDVEFSKSQKAERIFKEKWIEKGRTLKSDPVQKAKQIERYVRKLDLPNPSTTQDIESFIVLHSLAYR